MKLYTKDGRVSPCRVVYMAADDRWISNPTEEQILAAGWVEYTPPVVEEELFEESTNEGGEDNE